MGISFKLSKVGVRVQPTARSAAPGLPAAVETEKPGADEKDGSGPEAKREVSRVSIGLLGSVRSRGGRGGGPDDLGKQSCSLLCDREEIRVLPAIFGVFASNLRLRR